MLRLKKKKAEEAKAAEAKAADPDCASGATTDASSDGDAMECDSKGKRMPPCNFRR